MIDDIYIFDGVIHAYDLSIDNQRLERPDTAPMVAGWGQAMRPLRYPHKGLFGDEHDWSRPSSVEQMYKMEFVDSPVDMAMAHAVPVWEWFKDSFAPLRVNAALAQAHPDKVLLCGAVDPLYHGLEGALEQMEYQVKELGARSFKFYNGHVDGSWRCDDRELAYPLYEKARELGITVLQFHKGLPFGEWDVDVLRPVDLQAPAREFRDMNFVIHHLALPYFDEAVSIASRFQNVYLALSGVLNYLYIAPRMVQQWIGTLLMQVGPHKLIWGSEAPMTGPPAPFLRDFMNLQIPQDLCEGYGFPQITHEDKRMILGANMARLMNIDMSQRSAAVTASPVAM
jgi:predicted TIM-barrel fold metal-dependent hydrolase